MKKIVILKRKTKIYIFIALTVCIILAVAVVAFAKYYYHKEISGKTTEISDSYYLTLLKPDGTDYLNLVVGDMYPKETKQIVFCVSNRDPFPTADITANAGGSDFGYQLELIHTENLPVTYKMREVIPVAGQKIDSDYEINGNVWRDKGTISGVDISDSIANELFGNEEDVLNQGKYIYFEKDSNGNLLHLSSPTGIGYERDYYFLEISWNSDLTNISPYLKETDLVYIVVKALQPKPEKSN